MAKIPSRKFPTSKKQIPSTSFPTAKRKLSSGKLPNQTAKIPSRKFSNAPTGPNQEMEVPAPISRPADDQTRHSAVVKLKSRSDALKTASEL